MMEEKKRIYVVDDHALVREWLTNMLQQEFDFEVCGQADNASTALAQMTERPPHIAVVDLSLRSGTGLDLIKDLRIQCPATAVVVLSMHEEVDFVERALRAGARAYVTKAESTHQIVAAIRAVLAGQLYARNDILVNLTERMIGHSPSRQPGGIALLSDREMEVFRRLGEGQTSRRIAAEMKVSVKTVQSYSARIKDKLGLANISELLREAFKWAEVRNRI